MARERDSKRSIDEEDEDCHWDKAADTSVVDDDEEDEDEDGGGIYSNCSIEGRRKNSWEFSRCRCVGG